MRKEAQEIAGAVVEAMVGLSAEALSNRLCMSAYDRSGSYCGVQAVKPGDSCCGKPATFLATIPDLHTYDCGKVRVAEGVIYACASCAACAMHTGITWTRVSADFAPVMKRLAMGEHVGEVEAYSALLRILGDLVRVATVGGEFSTRWAAICLSASYALRAGLTVTFVEAHELRTMATKALLESEVGGG